MTEKIPWWKRYFAKPKPATPEPPLRCPVCGMLQTGEHLKMGYQATAKGVVCFRCKDRAILWAARKAREKEEA